MKVQKKQRNNLIMKCKMEPTITVYIYKGEKMYVAECLEIDVVTQGKSIDKAIKNIKEAIDLYFEGEEKLEIDLPPEPPIILSIGASKYVRA